MGAWGHWTIAIEHFASIYLAKESLFVWTN